MIPNQICKVLSTIQKHQVRALLMGGQACVLYGSGMFSRDVDFAILASDAHLKQLRIAMEELQAEVIAVPPFERQYLEAGLAVHFRCHHPEAEDLRVDVMAKMRGVADFEQVWGRRTSAVLPDGTLVEIMSIADLITAKKTQRDKDWPMITRIIDAHYKENCDTPTAERILFWLTESRSPETLMAATIRFPLEARQAAVVRPAVEAALRGDLIGAAALLKSEEAHEREADRLYWAPLRARLNQLRRERRDS